MEEKNKLSKILEDVNNNDTIVQNWIFEENARLKYEGDMETSFNDGVEVGKEAGIELGKEVGIELGKEVGIESSKVEMIKNMLNQNIDYSVISNVSCKTIEEIKEIEESMREES